MFQWTQELALREINGVISEIPFLRNEQRFSAKHAEWVARTLSFLEQVFGPNSRYFLSFAALTWGEQGSFIVGGMSDPEGSWNRKRQLSDATTRHFFAN